MLQTGRKGWFPGNEAVPRAGGGKKLGAKAEKLPENK